MFKIVMIIAAATIAVVAAFFSVSGIGKLFAGSFIPVVIMASALEMGKLVTASMLTRYWNKLSILLKVYYTIATLVLVLITSVGIYGFLTAAYQTTSDELKILDQQTAVLTLKRDRYQDQLNLYIQDREGINTRISDLTGGLSNNVIQYRDTVTNEIITTTSISTRNALQGQLVTAQEQRTETIVKIDEATDSITSLELQALTLQTSSEVAAEAGPLRYLSNLTGWSMDQVVNVFALLIVFVFDPLAISLVIGYNYIHVREEELVDKKKLYKIYNDPDNPKDEILPDDEVEIKVEEELIETSEATIDTEGVDVLSLREKNRFSAIARLQSK